MRFLLLIVLAILARTPLATGQPARSTPDARELVRHAVEHEQDNFARARNYTYIERAETHRQNGTNDSATWEVMILYGEHVRRLIARNDQPLSPQEQASEERRIQKLIDSRKNETPEHAKKRLAEYERRRAGEHAFVDEIADAYEFRLRGQERYNGRETYVVDVTPRRGYHPRDKRARMLPKFRGTLWIDKAEDEWVKLDAEAIDDIPFGWFLGKLNRGAHLIAEQTRVDDEVWLPQQVTLSLAGRKLFSSFGLEIDIRYGNYRKFRAESQIVAPVEAKPEQQPQ